jgi:hypothetical protein
VQFLYYLTSTAHCLTGIFIPFLQSLYLRSSTTLDQPLELSFAHHTSCDYRTSPFFHDAQSLCINMRLLERKSDGKLSLTEFFDDNIPPYAILSHTWEPNGEFTFEDLRNHTGKEKAGYAKVQFCGKQAAKDHVQYFWVDSCCIDKSSSAELTEAINSIFRWYRNSVKCYVYLSDVLTSGHDEHGHLPRSIWELGFRNSRWFTRGWTLQELLAPTSVEFFSPECTLLGNKKLME